MRKAPLNISVDDIGDIPIEKTIASGETLALTFWERLSEKGQLAGEYRLRRDSSAVRQVDQRWIRADRSPQILGRRHIHVMQLLGPSDDELVFQRIKRNGDWTYGQIRIKIAKAEDGQLRVTVRKPQVNTVRQVLEAWHPGSISAFHPDAGPYPVDPVNAGSRHLTSEEIAEIIGLVVVSEYQSVEESSGYDVYRFSKPGSTVELLTYDTRTGQRLGLLARDAGHDDLPSLAELKEACKASADNPFTSFFRERAAVIEEWPSSSPVGSIVQVMEAGHRFDQRRRELVQDDAKDVSADGLEQLMQAGMNIPAHELGGVNHDLREQSQAIADERGRSRSADDQESGSTQAELGPSSETDHPGMDADEILDLVDADDQVIGKLDRRSIYEQDLHNFRIVYGMISNSEDQLWTPRRSPAKAICPEHLDAGIGGHVKSGETYEAALAREGMEELSMDVIREDVVFLGTLTPDADGSYAYTKVYRINSETEPIFNPAEISGGEWLWPEEIVALAQSGEKIKSDLLVVCEALISGRLPE